MLSTGTPDRHGEIVLGGVVIATPESRLANDTSLIDVLSSVFNWRSAMQWKLAPSAAGVGCAAVAPPSGPLAAISEDLAGRIGPSATALTWATALIYRENG
jgi:hypothetical protein